MSKFFGQSSSDSESGSDDDSSVDQKAAPVAGTRFAIESDSDSEDEKRVVRSEYEKFMDAVQPKCKVIFNHLKNGDWDSTKEELNTLKTLLEKKFNKVLQQRGVPNIVIRTFATLQAAVKETSQSDLQKKAKQAFNYIKQKDLKWIRETFETPLLKYQADPSLFNDPAGSDSSSSDSDSSDSDSSDSDSSNSDSDDDASVASGSDADADSDSDWPSDSSSDDSDSDDDSDDGRPKLTGRAKWLKKVPGAGATDISDKKKKKKEQKEAKAALNKEEKASTRSNVKSSTMDEKMDEATLDLKVNNLFAARGRANATTDLGANIRQLDQLYKIAKKSFGERKELRILMLLCSLMFDQYRMKIDLYMPLSEWRIVGRYLRRVLEIVEKDENKDMRLVTISIEDVALTSITRRGNKGKELPPEEEMTSKADKNKVIVVATLQALMIRLEENYTKSLQQINNSNEKDEKKGSAKVSIIIVDRMMMYCIVFYLL